MLLPHRPLSRHVIGEQRHAGSLQLGLVIGEARQRALDQGGGIIGGIRVAGLQSGQGRLGAPLLFRQRSAHGLARLIQIGQLQSQHHGIVRIGAADVAAGQSQAQVTQIIAHAQLSILQLIAHCAVQRRAPCHQSRADAGGNVVGIGEIPGRTGQHLIGRSQPLRRQVRKVAGGQLLASGIPCRWGRLIGPIRLIDFGGFVGLGGIARICGIGIVAGRLRGVVALAVQSTLAQGQRRAGGRGSRLGIGDQRTEAGGVEHGDGQQHRHNGGHYPRPALRAKRRRHGRRLGRRGAKLYRRGHPPP